MRLPDDPLFERLPDDVGDEVIESRVASLLERVAWVGVPVDVEAIASRMGIPVHALRVDPATGVRAMLEPGKDGGAPAILVRHDASRWQRRFAVAHMIGHLVADHASACRDGVLDTDRAMDEGRMSEGVANRFANALLMPEADIRSLVAEMGATGLGNAFDMHPKAVIARAHHLGLSVRLP